MHWQQSQWRTLNRIPSVMKKTSLPRKELSQKIMDSQSFARHYLEDLSRLLLEIDAGAIAKAVQWLRDARDAQRTIYSCGNGGSALIASQMVCDIVKGASWQKPSRSEERR